MKNSITNYEFKITNLKLRLLTAAVSMIFCVFVGDSFGQVVAPIDAEYFAVRIGKGNDEQKRDALFQLRNFKTAEASRIALPALKDSSEIVRATATASVVFLPPEEAVRNLLPLLGDKKDFVRRETAYALGKTHSLLAVQPLIQKFQNEKIGDVKNAIVIALGEISDVSVIPFLTQILQKPPKKESDADEFLRRSAARSIGQTAQFLQTGANEIFTPENLLIKDDLKSFVTNPPYKNLATDNFDFRAAETILIKTLQSRNESDDTKREAAFALGAIGDGAAVRVLQSNLNAVDYYLARICLEALGKIKK